MIVGVITFSSICPAWTAKDVAKSFPTTWYATMSRHSAITGFTFPGIIEEPGCTGGKTISLNPVVGPEARSRKSFAMRISSKANSLSPLETVWAALWLCSASKLFDAVLSGKPVSFASSATASACILDVHLLLFQQLFRLRQRRTDFPVFSAVQRKR